ncbi:MAG TPA: response regulator [Candidatus Dormibacteraeota bacterium]|nr:response regulator [Candidatus Dormibacteraeota bacterium]
MDDSQEILFICRTVLEAEGYQVFTAASAAAALEMLQMHSVAAAVIDNVMPGMSGIALAREIKRIASDVRVILFSSLERPDEIVPFIDSYLSKGQGPLALRKLIGSLLHK